MPPARAPSGRPGSSPCSTRPTRSRSGRGGSTTRCSASRPDLGTGNFTGIGTDDLERLFAAYDREFFRGRLGEMLHEDGAHPMDFRLSRRLISAAGQTMRLTRPIRRAGRRSTQVEYEITVSTTLLFNTFQNVDRMVTVGGLECRDRLEALQRIFEHELLHLAEFLGWGRSNCRAGNFHALSRRIFAHEGVFHDLVTPREEAGVAYRHRRRRPGQLRARGRTPRRPRQPDHAPRHRPGRETRPAGSTPTASVISPSTCRCRCCRKV